MITCEKCRGLGHTHTPHGFLSIATQCPACKGYGKVQANPTKHDRRWDDQITWRSGLIIMVGSIVACVVMYGAIIGLAHIAKVIP